MVDLEVPIDKEELMLTFPFFIFIIVLGDVNENEKRI